MAAVSYLLTDGLGNFTTGGGSALTAAQIAAAVWNAATSSYTTPGSTALALTSRASQESVDTIEGALEEIEVTGASVDVDVAAIRAKTDGLTFTVPGTVDANVALWRANPVPAEDTPGYPVVTIKVGTGMGELELTNGAVNAVATITDKTGYTLSAAGIDMIFDEIVVSTLPAGVSRWLRLDLPRRLRRRCGLPVTVVESRS